MSLSHAFSRLTDPVDALHAVVASFSYLSFLRSKFLTPHHMLFLGTGTALLGLVKRAQISLLLAVRLAE